MFRSSDRGRFLSAHRMAMDAVFIALHVVLSLFSIYILGDQIKLSFASFPLLVASLLFGMTDGLLVAGIGEFLYQSVLQLRPDDAVVDAAADAARADRRPVLSSATASTCRSSRRPASCSPPGW